MTDIKVGDRVKVTLEGTVSHISTTWMVIGDHEIHRTAMDMVPSIEKVEPPVKVFKPGDVVRRADGGVALTLLCDNGYVEMYTNGEPPKFFEYGTLVKPETFTSKKYERVNLVEVPF